MSDTTLIPGRLKENPVRSEDEIVKAHDLLNQIISGDLPEVHPGDEQSYNLMVAAQDVLCWVLDHDHNHSFTDNLSTLRNLIGAAGYELTELDGYKASGMRH